MKAKSSYDAVVVGAGPAGSSSAATLARAGLRVALLDKARFPRDKLCGGLISQRSRNILAQVFGSECEPPIEGTCKGAKIFFKDWLLNEVRGYKPIYFTSRCTFDHYLLGLARSYGVDVIEGVGVSGLTSNRSAVLLVDGKCYEAPFVIGADGASSRIRKELHSVSIDKEGFAVGLEMEVPKSFVKRDVVDPEIYFGVVRRGYGWVFPKKHALTVGVGGLAAANTEMRRVFECFARMAIGGVPIQPLRGHPIPFGNYLPKPGENSVLLVGDAAGLVEPITGEGIAFAMLSGYQAAQAVIEATRLGVAERALPLYEEQYKTIVRLFNDAKLLRYLAFSKLLEPLFARALNLSTGVIKMHMDVLAGDADYRDYSKYLVGTVVQCLPKIIGSLAKGAA